MMKRLAFAALLAVMGCTGPVGAPGSVGPAGPMQCLFLGLIISFVPWVIAMVLLWRGLPTAPTLTGAVAGMAAGLYGLAMLHLSCPNTSLMHLMFFHGGVIVLASLLGAGIGRLVLRKSS